MRRNHNYRSGIIAALITAAFCMQAIAADVKPLDDAHKKTATKLIDGGVKYLLTQKDAKGGWSMEQGSNRPAITAMVLKVLLQHPDYNSSTPVVKKGFAQLMTYRKTDGGFYEPTVGLPNYTTSIAIMAMVAANDPKFKPDIDKAVKFLRTQQIGPGDKTPKGETVKKGEGYDGGVSYGKHGRPDGSNNQMWIQAMHDAGVKADDPDLQRLNLESVRGLAASDAERQLVDRCIERVEGMQRTYAGAAYEQLSGWVIHGDYTPANLLFSESGQVVGIFDLDWALPGARCRDLGDGLYFFATRPREIDAGDIWSLTEAAEFDEDRCRIFLEAYQSVLTLERCEFEAIPLGFAGRWISIRLEGMAKVDSGERFRFFGRGVEEPLRWLDTHWAELQQ